MKQGYNLFKIFKFIINYYSLHLFLKKKTTSSKTKIVWTSIDLSFPSFLSVNANIHRIFFFLRPDVTLTSQV